MACVCFNGNACVSYNAYRSIYVYNIRAGHEVKSNTSSILISCKSYSQSFKNNIHCQLHLFRHAHVFFCVFGGSEKSRLCCAESLKSSERRDRSPSHATPIQRHTVVTEVDTIPGVRYGDWWWLKSSRRCLQNQILRESATQSCISWFTRWHHDVPCTGNVSSYMITTMLT